jgi:hypothetical protein
MKPPVKKRNMVRSNTAITSLIKTIVRGRYISLAILNQIKENDQKIIARMTPAYVLILSFKTFTGYLLIPEPRIYTI